MFEVYIHVPFCLRRCGYCDFNTYTAVDLGGGASRGNYAAMTIREMRLVRDWQEASRHRRTAGLDRVLRRRHAHILLPTT